jgi:hypothetical protein
MGFPFLTKTYKDAKPKRANKKNAFEITGHNHEEALKELFRLEPEPEPELESELLVLEPEPDLQFTLPPAPPEVTDDVITTKQIEEEVEEIEETGRLSQEVFPQKENENEYLPTSAQEYLATSEQQSGRMEYLPVDEVVEIPPTGKKEYVAVSEQVNQLKRNKMEYAPVSPSIPEDEAIGPDRVLGPQMPNLELKVFDRSNEEIVSKAAPVSAILSEASASPALQTKNIGKGGVNL